MALNERSAPIIFLDPGRSPGAFTHVQPSPQAIVDDPLSLDPDLPSGGAPVAAASTTPASDAQRNGVLFGNAMQDWYEHIHVVARSYAFGNLLSNQSVAIEVFSAYRRAPHTWTAFVNNAGAGVELVGQPPLPTTLFALDGIQMTLDVSTVGDPFVDDTLDFFFDVSTILVPITVQRIVLWGLRPELPFVETLGFATNIIRAKGGTERRQRKRKNPRQRWNYDYLAEEGVEKQRLENLLFDWQARTFGVPVWFDESELTVAASSGATSLTVDGTSFRDYRVGGLVCVFVDQLTFDVIEVDSIGATTIGLVSPLLNSYPIGTSVFPLRTCDARPMLEGGRWPVGLSKLGIEFEATDNELSIASTAAFATFNGKVLLDNGNSVLGGQVRETFSVEVIRIDSETGVWVTGSPQSRHRRGHLLSLRAEGRQAIWEMRQLVHALGGRHVSFYIPRDSDDLALVANLTSGANTMTVTHVGYSQFVRQRTPRNVVRVSFVDGSTPLLRTVTGSSAPSSTTEQLVLNANWPSTFTPAQVSRVEYVEKVRMDDDDVRFEFRPETHLAHLVAPLLTVLE